MNLRHMFGKNENKKTAVKTEEKTKAKAMNPEVVKKINKGVGVIAEEDSKGILRFKESLELKNWQWEIILENESKNEDQD